MNKYGYCIVGAGIVGLATAYALIRKYPNSKILVLEKENCIGLHQTGRNSGVIHAGIYYNPGSLKSQLCKNGLEETKTFCKNSNVPYEECGKLIVATNQQEIERIEKLSQNAKENDIKLSRLSANELRNIEPNIVGTAALLSPKTAIVDYGRLALTLFNKLIDLGVDIKLKSEVISIDEDKLYVEIKTRESLFHCEYLISCGGLQSDRLAKMVGIETDFKIIPFRGEYYRLKPNLNNIVKHLIYPVPDPDLPFLGVHLTRMIGGYVTVGPNASIGFSREGYSKLAFNLEDFFDYSTYPGFYKLIRQYKKYVMHEALITISKRAYLKECKKFCPTLEANDLIPYRAGIRAQAVSNDGKLVHDFLIKKTNRSLHVCNAPSPAATSALPIGKYIVEMCEAI